MRVCVTSLDEDERQLEWLGARYIPVYRRPTRVYGFQKSTYPLATFFRDEDGQPRQHSLSFQGSLSY